MKYTVRYDASYYPNGSKTKLYVGTIRQLSNATDTLRIEFASLPSGFTPYLNVARYAKDKSYIDSTPTWIGFDEVTGGYEKTLTQWYSEIAGFIDVSVTLLGAEVEIEGEITQERIECGMFYFNIEGVVISQGDTLPPAPPATEIEFKVDKSMSAYTLMGNDTNATANAKNLSISEVMHLLSPLDKMEVPHDLEVLGNLFVRGTGYKVELETLEVEKDTILLRDGALTGLATGEYAGLIFHLYDGTNNGFFGVDKDGYAKVGDVGDLQTLATRQDTPIANGLAYWNDTLKRFDTDALVTVATLRDHSLLSNRTIADQHTIGSITDLTAQLSAKAPLIEPIFTNNAVGDVPLIVNAMAGTTANLFNLQVDGITKSYFDKNGYLWSKMMFGTDWRNDIDISYSRIGLHQDGVQIFRNIADSKPALLVDQVNLLSTGNILELKHNGIIKAFVDVYGNANFNEINGGIFSHTTNGDKYLRALGTRIYAKTEPSIILLQSDSTGASTTEKWFYYGIEYMGEKLPTHTIQYRFWDETTRCFKTNKNIQYGSMGDAYAQYPNASGSYISTSDSVDNSILGDIDIRVKVKYEAGTSPSLLAKWAGGGNSSYWFTVGDADGRLTLYWTPDGSTVLSRSSSITDILTSDAKWWRVTLDVDNGAGGYVISFYHSVDGENWTQIDVSYTGPTTTSIFNSTAVVELGSRATGTSNYFGGRYYAAEVRNGINGKIVLSPDLDLAFPAGISSFKDAEGNVWTINGTVTVGNGSPSIYVLNAGYPGSGIAWATYSSTFELHTKLEPQVALINFSHNEDLDVSYQSKIKTLADLHIAKYPNVRVFVSTQNPQKSPRTQAQINAHSIRNRQIAIASAVYGYGLVDAFRAITIGGVTTLVSSDGVHPSEAGYLVWANEFIKQLICGVIDE